MQHITLASAALFAWHFFLARNKSNELAKLTSGSGSSISLKISYNLRRPSREPPLLADRARNGDACSTAAPIELAVEPRNWRASPDQVKATALMMIHQFDGSELADRHLSSRPSPSLVAEQTYKIPHGFAQRIVFIPFL